MIILDTDHSSVLKYPGTERYNRLVARLAGPVDEVVAVNIIGVEEQMRGWLASIAKEKQAKRQTPCIPGTRPAFRVLCQVRDRPR